MGRATIRFACLLGALGQALAGAGELDTATRARLLVRRMAEQPTAARDGTARRLAALGRRALPAIEEATRHADADVARRARGLALVWQRYAALCEEIAERTDHVDEAAGALVEAGPLTFDALVAAYRDEPAKAWYLREWIVRLLPRIDRRRALAFFSTILSGKDAHMNSSVIHAGLRGVPTAEAAPLLVSALAHEKRDTFLQAAGALGSRGGPAVEPVLKLLAGRDPKRRACAAEALAWFRDLGRDEDRLRPRIVATLVGAQSDADPLVRGAATRSLHAHSPDHLRHSFTHTDAVVRAAALDFAVGQRMHGLKSDLLRGLRDSAPEVRWAAARGLKRDSGQDVVEALTEALDDRSVKVRLMVVKALRGRKEDAPAGRLLAMARDAAQPLEIRAQALGALGTLGEAAPVEALLALAEDGRQPTRVRAAAASNALLIRHSKTLAFARKVLGDPALRSLERDDSLYPYLARPTDVPMGHTQRLGTFASSTLVLWGTTRDADLIVSAVVAGHVNPGILGSLSRKGEHMVPAVGRALAEGRVPVRRSALRALALVGGRRACSLAIEALRDVSAKVRTEAALALRHIKSKRAVPALVERLADEAESARAAAATTLVVLGDNRAKQQAIAYHRKNLRAAPLGPREWYQGGESAAFLIRHALRKGMTKAEVAAVLGYPPGTKGKADRWSYTTGYSAYLGIVFEQGRLAHIHP